MAGVTNLGHANIRVRDVGEVGEVLHRGSGPPTLSSAVATWFS